MQILLIFVVTKLILRSGVGSGMGCNLSVLLRCQYQVTNHWDLLAHQNPSLNARIFCRGVIIIVFDDCYIIA